MNKVKSDTRRIKRFPILALILTALILILSIAPSCGGGGDSDEASTQNKARLVAAQVAIQERLCPLGFSVIPKECGWYYETVQVCIDNERRVSEYQVSVCPDQVKSLGAHEACVASLAALSDDEIKKKWSGLPRGCGFLSYDSSGETFLTPECSEASRQIHAYSENCKFGSGE